MTAFKDMPEPVRQRWLDWADSHDWGQGIHRAYYSRVTNEVVVAGYEVQPNGDGHIVFARHSCPRDLKAWAGY